MVESIPIVQVNGDTKKVNGVTPVKEEFIKIPEVTNHLAIDMILDAHFCKGGFVSHWQSRFYRQVTEGRAETPGRDANFHAAQQQRVLQVEA